MRSFIYSLIFSSTCMLPLHQAQAQKKQTIYYPNGKVAFEGRFQLAWNQKERFEYINVDLGYITLYGKHAWLDNKNKVEICCTPDGTSFKS